jgi:hypothetical protein
LGAQEGKGQKKLGKYSETVLKLNQQCPFCECTYNRQCRKKFQVLSKPPKVLGILRLRILFYFFQLKFFDSVNKNLLKDVKMNKKNTSNSPNVFK